MSCRSLVLLLLASLLLAPAPAAAAQHDRLGPLPGRTRNPLYLMHLQPTLRRAAPLERGELAISVDVEHANISDRWVVPGGWGTVAEVTDIDCETVRTGITARYGLPFGIELGLEVPLITLNGGWMDAGIQGWHFATGLSNGDREFIDNDRYNVRLSRDGWFMKRDQPVPLALGDVEVSVLAELVRADFVRALPGVSARMMVKLPTGRFDLGAGSGTPDMAVVLLGEWGYRPMTWYAQLGFIALGRAGHLGPALHPASFTWAIGLELNPVKPWSIMAQFHSRTVFHAGFEHPVIALSPLGFQVGMKLRVGPIDVGVSFGQDPLMLDPTEDLALLAHVGARIPTRKKVEQGRADPVR